MLERLCRLLLVAAICMAGMQALDARGAGDKWGKKPADYSPILDDVSDPMYSIGWTYIPSRHFSGYGSSAVMELDADWEFAYLRNFLDGDMALRLRAQDTIFTRSAHLDLPSQLLLMALDTTWSTRLQDGFAIRAGAAPGMYSDAKELGGDCVFVPVSCSVVRTFAPEMAGIIGLQLRLGFDQVLMPILGLQFDVGRDVVLAMAIPESKLVWFVNREWTSRLGMKWNNVSYRLHDDRDLMTIEDFRFFWELRYRYTDQLEFIGDLGYVFDRQVQFDRNPSGDVDVDDAAYIRLGIGGPF